jgi:hypothetical protein
MPTLIGSAATRSDLLPLPPHHPTPIAHPLALTHLHSMESTRQRPRSNCSPAWRAPPSCCLLYSRCLPGLLHAPTVLSPRPRSSQADAPPPLHLGCLPRPGLCHLSLWHALAPPRHRLTTSHHCQCLHSACRPPDSAGHLGPLSGIAPPTTANEWPSKV